MTTGNPKQLILAAGFHTIQPCMCGGVRTLKFKRNDYVIRYRESRASFKVSKGNTVLHNYTPITKLETILNGLVAENTTAQV